MNALIDLESCREHMKIFVAPGEKEILIKLAGTSRNPYFCGRDVCDVLDHKDAKYALKTHVPPKYKTNLSHFYGPNGLDLRTDESGEDVVADQHSCLGKSTITFRESQAVYISESGLYSLIMNSKTAAAKKFQELVYDTILPSIRTHGYYTVEQKLLSKERELKQALMYGNKLRDILATSKAKSKDQIVYVATTLSMAKQNRFKIGGVKSRSLLKGRLSTYNTGRPVGDKMYYACLVETVDYHHVEQRIKKVIGDHIDSGEIYHLHYESLEPLVRYLTERFDQEMDHHATLFDALVKATLTKTPTVPEPILLNGAEFRTIQNGIVVSIQLVDFDTMSDHDKSLFVDSVLAEFSAHKGESPLIRHEFERYMVDVKHAKFNKKTLWSYTKQAAVKIKKRVKY